MTRQAKRLSDGEINRRRFVMSALSAGVTMPTALSLASKAEASIPKRGGTLRMAFAEGASKNKLAALEPANTFARTLAFAHGNALTEIDDNGDVIGELASTIEHSNGHRRWAFGIRDGVVFHDGTPMSPEHVLQNVRRWQSSGLLPEIANIHLNAGDQLEITLHTEEPGFPRRLADSRMIVLSLGSTQENPIGTGPYRIENTRPDQSVDLKRFDAYWKPNRAHFDGARLSVIPDAHTRQAALMTGEIDVADRIDPRGVALLQRASNLQTSEVDAASHLHITFDAKTPPFDSHDLRNAILHCIPAQALAEQVLLNHGKVSETVNTFDVETAKLLYERSGHKGRLKIATDGHPITRETIRMFRDAAKQAGIQLVEERNEVTGARMGVSRGVPQGSAELHVTLWINDITAYANSLSRTGPSSSNLLGAEDRVVERWWFA